MRRCTFGRKRLTSTVLQHLYHQNGKNVRFIFNYLNYVTFNKTTIYIRCFKLIYFIPVCIMWEKRQHNFALIFFCQTCVDIVNVATDRGIWDYHFQCFFEGVKQNHLTFKCLISQLYCLISYISAGNYMFKVNNRNTRTRCEIYPSLTIQKREWSQ